MANIRKPVNATQEVKKRAPIFDRKDRLAFVDDPKYHRVWVADVKTSVQDYLDSGFQFVHNDDRWGKTSDRDIDAGSSLDSRVQENMGKAGGMENVTGYLMQVPLEEWEEMRKPLIEEARAPVAELQNQTRDMIKQGFYGKSEIKQE